MKSFVFSPLLRMLISNWRANWSLISPLGYKISLRWTFFHLCHRRYLPCIRWACWTRPIVIRSIHRRIINTFSFFPSKTNNSNKRRRPSMRTSTAVRRRRIIRVIVNRFDLIARQHRPTVLVVQRSNRRRKSGDHGDLERHFMFVVLLSYVHSERKKERADEDVSVYNLNPAIRQFIRRWWDAKVNSKICVHTFVDVHQAQKNDILCSWSLTLDDGV